VKAASLLPFRCFEKKERRLAALPYVSAVPVVAKTGNAGLQRHKVGLFAFHDRSVMLMTQRLESQAFHGEA
jgi:hypothetical protein